MARATRRQFARLVAVLPLAASADLAAQATQPATTIPPADTDEKTLSLAEALAGVVRAEYGAHLTRDDLVRIRKDFDDAAGAYQRLREVSLANSDEPDFTFTVTVTR